MVVSGGSITEGGTVVLSTAMLSVGNTGETPPENFVFTVTSRTDGDVPSPFTLADLQAGSVEFSHDGSEGSQAGFLFTVNDAGTGDAIATGKFLPLDVVPVDDLPTVTVAGGRVPEGGTLALTPGMLYVGDPDTAPAAIVMTVTSPTNGQVAVNDQLGTSSFTLEDLQEGRVTFVHDGSETTSAGFDFSVSYFGGDVLVPAQPFPLTVDPVDDAPEVTVGRGEVEKGGLAAITPELLSASDIDTAQDSIVFTLAGGAGGQVLLNNNPASAFTAADVSAGGVQFEHDGSGGQTASFSFTVGYPGGPSDVVPEQKLTMQVAPGPSVVINGGKVFQVRRPYHLLKPKRKPSNDGDDHDD